MTRRFAPSIDALVAGTFALLGVGLGARAIGDNSAFTHIRTGVDMVQHGLLPAIPRTDPYTFTAHGHPWVVQSWLAEAGVGWTFRLFGQHAIPALAAVTMGLLAFVVASLARTGRPERTALAAFASLAVGLPFWTPRPLLVGLLALAATIWVVNGRKAPWLLVPVVWIWVNSHGSFPLGLAWLVATCVGAWIDRRWRNVDEEAPWTYLGWFGVGLVASIANPLGPKLLTFAATPVAKGKVFQQIIEWQSVNFHEASGLVCLAGLVVGLLVLVRHRLPWRIIVPVVGFVAMGLYAQRNLAPLGVVLAPALAFALRDDAPRASETNPTNRVLAVGLAVIALLMVFSATKGDPINAKAYPDEPVTWLVAQHRFDTPHRIAAQDTDGNYMELRRVPDGAVFIDDRYDMFPTDVSLDYIDMVHNPSHASRVLDRYDVDTVLWAKNDPMIAFLTADGAWTVAHRHADWVVLYRS